MPRHTTHGEGILVVNHTVDVGEPEGSIHLGWSDSWQPRRIREKTGVPIVTITYDGTSSRMNDAIVPYIQKALVKSS